MAEAQISESEIAEYRACVGRTHRETDSVSPHAAAMMAATLDHAQPVRDLPPMWHYGLFHTAMPTSKLGLDGHPPRGDFMPPVKLPRRMFAGSDLRFLQPLQIGETVTRDSRIVSVEHRHGKTGDLVFVRVAIEIGQAGKVCIEENQTIVYRGAGVPTPAVIAKPRAALAEGEASQDWTPNSVELFRYSAAIFVAHRIHFDFPYVTQEEGYPGLIVTGPLTATRLHDFAAKLAGRAVARFRFRGESPLFADQPVRLVGLMDGAECAVRAERADGVTAMSATANF
jgi:3-methylfumaryl-CoA hydratase